MPGVRRHEVQQSRPCGVYANRTAPAEPVLAAWGITTEGKPIFVGLEPAGSESTDADFLTALGARGLACSRWPSPTAPPG